jgi:hypothetical protein
MPGPAQQRRKIAPATRDDVPAEPSHNQNGQALGPKGRVTRERLMNATAELLVDSRVLSLFRRRVIGGARSCRHLHTKHGGAAAPRGRGLVCGRCL